MSTSRRSLIAGITFILLAGCGTTTKVVTVTKTVSAGGDTSTTTASTSSSTATTVASPSGPPQCSDVVLEDVKHCNLNGSLIVIAHQTAPLRLKGLTIQLVGVHTADTVSNGSGFTSTAHGVYLIASLKVSNGTSSPQTFDDVGANQTLLEINGSSYTESFEAENTNDPNSFITNNDGIQSGESQTGDVVFDVPPSRASQATKDGRSGLFVGRFGEDLSQGVGDGTGFITLQGV